MILRPARADRHFITQPDHAALAARIMEQWRAGGLGERGRAARQLGRDPPRRHVTGRANRAH